MNRLAMVTERLDSTGRLVMVALGGVLFGLSFPPFHLVVLIIPSFASLYVGLRGAQSSYEGLRLGLTFTLFFYPVHAYWFVNFHLLALPGVLVVLGFWYSIWGYLLISWGVNPWTAAGSWILLQKIIGSGYLAFPWSRISTSLAIHAELIQPVRWVGELVWGGLIVLLIFSVTEKIVSDNFPWRIPLAVVFFVGSLFVVSLVQFHNQKQKLHPESVTMVQPNVPSGFARNSYKNQFRKLRHLTTSSTDRGSLIVWPETAVSNFPFDIRDNGKLAYRSSFTKSSFQDLLNSGEQLFFGVMFRDPKPNQLDYLNGAVIIDHQGNPRGFYTKRRPVPAGEHLPFMGQFEWVKKLGRTLGTMGYRPGKLGGLVPVQLGSNTIEAGVQICFEDAFPGLVLKQVRKGAELLINISNDSWSRSPASHRQHFYRAKIRAVEVGLPLLRNGNTGITAVIDPMGRVPESLGVYRSGVVTARIPKPMSYTGYRLWGEWVTWFVLIPLIGMGTVRPFPFR